MPTDPTNAFTAYLHTGHPQAALDHRIGQSGGYLAPPEYVADLIKTLNSASWMRSLAQVFGPSQALAVKRPTRTADGTRFQWGNDVTGIVQGDEVKFGQLTFVPYPMCAEFEVPEGVLNAEPTNEMTVRGEIAEQASVREEIAFVSGDRVQKPLGLFCPSDAGIPVSRDRLSPSNDVYRSLFSAMLSLKSAYLLSESLRWVMHPNALKAIADLRDATGEPVWEWPKDSSVPISLFGVKIELSDSAPAGSGPGGAYLSGDYLALVGDLKFYGIQDGFTLEVSRHDDSFYSRRGMVGFIARRRVAGAPMIAEAFVRVKLS